MRTPPDQRQRQRSHTAHRDDDKGFSEIPFESILSMGSEGGPIEELAAMFTLYCRFLNLFSTIRALLHKALLLADLVRKGIMSQNRTGSPCRSPRSCVRVPR